jgi:hypothetical protein
MAQKATFADEDNEDRRKPTGVSASFADGLPAPSRTPAPTPNALPSEAGRPAPAPLFTREELIRRGIAPDITAPGESFTRGVMDVGQGLKQLYLMATDPAAAKAYTADVNRQIAEYQQRRGSEAGLDFARMGGGMVATAPAMLIPGGQATLPARLGMGALAGGLSSAAEFAPSGTAGEKAVQAGLGATVGAVLPEVAGTAARGIVGAGQAAVSALKPITNRSSNAEILTLLQQAGQKIDFTFDIGKIGKDARDRLVADAKAQLKTNDVIDPLALVRRQDFEKLGIDPTRGQITRDPRQFQMEQNLAQVAGVGDPLLERMAQQQGQFGRALEAVRPGGALPSYEAGAQVVEAVGTRVGKSGTYGELGKSIDEAFNKARSAAGSEALLPFEQYQARIAQTLDDFEDKIPAPITKRLAAFAEGTDRDFSVKEAAKFRQMLTGRISGSTDPAEQSALRALKTNLDEFFINTAANAGPDAVDAIRLFRQGVGLSAERAKAFEAEGLQAVVKNKVVPEDFVNKFVIGGKIDDLRRLRDVLNRTDVSPDQQAQNLAAWDAIRNQAVQYMMNAASKEEGKFSQAAYRNAYEKFGTPTGRGNSKMEILFTPDEIGTLSAIRRASEAAFAAPPSGGVPLVNRSGTAAAAANLLGRVPLLGTGVRAIGEAFQQAGQVGQVARALNVEEGISPAVGAAQAQLRDLAASVASDVDTRTVPPMSAPLIQQLRENEERRKRQLPQTQPQMPQGLLF